MILVIKITEKEFDDFSPDFLNSLDINISNSLIKKIIIFVNFPYFNLNKLKTIVIQNNGTDVDLLKQVCKIYPNKTIIWANKLAKFDNTLSRLNKIDLIENLVYVNSKFNGKENINSLDALIFNSNSKIEYSDTIISSIMSKKISLDINVINKKPDINTEKVMLKVLKQSSRRISIKNYETIITKKEIYKLSVIIVSVNYNDYLLVSLSNNIKYFEDITVVTSSDDLVCQKICDIFGVKCIITDRIYEEGASFNKGKAINDGIKSIDNPDWILLLDADIVLTKKIDINDDVDVLYTSDRYICKDYNTYKDWQGGKIEIDKVGKYETNRGLGFFHLFNINSSDINKELPFPESSNDASWSDLHFRDKFTKKSKIDKSVIHLGPTYKNWKGRKTDAFLSDDLFNELYKKQEVTEPKYKEFELNTYFDKIYCLNLKKRENRWIYSNYQFINNNISVERYDAIDGELIDFNDNDINLESFSRKGIIESKGALGCLKSHLEIIKDAKSKNYKRILIFEDDILLIDNFNEEVKKIENIDWNLLYLGASQFEWSNIKPENGLYKCSKTLGTFAYALDISIYDEVLKMGKSSKKSIDNILSDIQKSNDKCYTLFPNIVISDVSESDIRSPKSIVEYSNQVKWNLDKFSNISHLERIKSTTIIIPCYGHSKYLEECIDSCLSQSIRPGVILVLLMDEDSILMKSKIENKSNIIKCIISGKMKLSEARNFCVDEIETEYFIPLDADDKIPKNFIEEICKIESDVVYIGSEYFGSQSGVWPDPITEEINWTKLTTFRRNSLVCTALIKKESFIKSGKYNESLWAFEDMDLWVRMYKNNFIFKKCFNTKLLYRKHSSSESLLSQANSNEENRKELKKIIMNDDFYKKTPKIIHWVWIGNNPAPEEVVKTWKKNLPEGDWEYMLWNENNFDMNSCEFLKKSYESKKYGICVDYIRAKVLYEYGGVWLDADCLITNDISPFLQYDFFGSWENINYLNIGLIGCSPKMDIIKEILDYYTNINIDDSVIKSHNRFVNEIGTGPMVLTKELMKIKNIRNGGFTNDFIFNNKKYLIETPEIFVLDDSNSGKINYAIHLFDGSWTDKKEEWSVVVRRSYNNWKNENKI